MTLLEKLHVSWPEIQKKIINVLYYCQFQMTCCLAMMIKIGPKGLSYCVYWRAAAAAAAAAAIVSPGNNIFVEALLLLH